MKTIEFFVSRSGIVTVDGLEIGRFVDQATGADMAVRFAQDQDALYRIFYV